MNPFRFGPVAFDVKSQRRLITVLVEVGDIEGTAQPVSMRAIVEAKLHATKSRLGKYDHVARRSLNREDEQSLPTLGSHISPADCPRALHVGPAFRRLRPH